jgi:hypothetical protein
MVLGPTAPATGRPAHGVKATIDKVLLVLVVDAARSRKASGQDVGIAVIKVTCRADTGELRKPPPRAHGLASSLAGCFSDEGSPARLLIVEAARVVDD